MNKFFFHHVKRSNGAMDGANKGIDVYDTLNAAEQSYYYFVGAWGYGNRPDTDFVSAFVTDENGNVVRPLSETWFTSMPVNTFFMHRIKHDAVDDSVVKGIEIHDSLDSAKQSFSAYLGAYAYDVSTADYVSCMITDAKGFILLPYARTWSKEEPEPETEP